MFDVEVLKLYVIDFKNKSLSAKLWILCALKPRTNKLRSDMIFCSACGSLVRISIPRLEFPMFTDIKVI